MTIDSPPTYPQLVNSKDIQTYIHSAPSSSTMQQSNNPQFHSLPGEMYNAKLKKVHKTTSFKRKLFDDIDSFSGEDDGDIIITSASPFKVTKILSDDSSNKSFDMFLSNSPLQNQLAASQSTGLNKNKKAYEKPNMVHNCSIKCEDILDIVNKTLRVVLKTKYDVEEIIHKQDQLETTFTYAIFQKETISQNVSNSQSENYFEMLPIADEDSLTKFEEKLAKDKTFRFNLISELKRNAKRNLTATVRQLLRTIYHDTLLKDYSFKGQKSKKVFSTLASCSVIFESVRKMKQYENVTNTDIQAPLTIYIAGASSRINKNKKGD